MVPGISSPASVPSPSAALDSGDDADAGGAIRGTILHQHRHQPHPWCLDACPSKSRWRRWQLDFQAFQVGCLEGPGGQDHHHPAGPACLDFATGHATRHQDITLRYIKSFMLRASSFPPGKLLAHKNRDGQAHDQPKDCFQTKAQTLEELKTSSISIMITMRSGRHESCKRVLVQKWAKISGITSTSCSCQCLLS